MPPKKKKNQQDSLSTKELAREYGFGWKFFKNDPELWDLLQEATKGNWTDTRFVAKFKATKWYKKHGETYRTNMGLKFTDPASYRERLTTTRSMVNNLAGQWGARLTDRELDKYSERAFMLGWDEGQILNIIAKEVTPGRGGHYGGELSGIESQLRQTAAANGITLNKNQTKTWMRQIVRGEADVRTYDSYIRDLAAKTFSAYGQEIKAGMNVVDVASPYVQSMASILELNPTSVGMDDRTIRKAMTHRNEKGEAQPMSIADFEDSLRGDKRWQYTDQAHEQMQGYAIEMGKMWGVL